MNIQDILGYLLFPVILYLPISASIMGLNWVKTRKLMFPETSTFKHFLNVGLLHKDILFGLKVPERATIEIEKRILLHNKLRSTFFITIALLFGLMLALFLISL